MRTYHAGMIDAKKPTCQESGCERISGNFVSFPCAEMVTFTRLIIVRGSTLDQNVPNQTSCLNSGKAMHIP